MNTLTLLLVVLLLVLPQATTGLASPLTNRRDVLQTSASVVATTLLLVTLDEQPAGASSAEINNSDPILVLGASGKTGRECVNYILQTGRCPCIATTRTGVLEGDYYGAASPSANGNLLTISKADVTSPDSLQEAIGRQRLAGVIYAASASKKGGSAKAVDCDGVVEAAKVCIAAQVPRFVVVSSGSVTQPDSFIYKLLNSFDRIMESKISGENEVRRLYSDTACLKQNLGYTVVRPGGLTLDPAVGAANLELNQGDTILGRLPRADVAALCVESIYSADAFDTTFECYEALTAKLLGTVGFSNLGK